jgi:hypothetical protein
MSGKLQALDLVSEFPRITAKDFRHAPGSFCQEIADAALQSSVPDQFQYQWAIAKSEVTIFRLPRRENTSFKTLNCKSYRHSHTDGIQTIFITEPICL